MIFKLEDFMVDTLLGRSDDVRVYGVINKFILKNCNSRAKKGTSL